MDVGDESGKQQGTRSRKRPKANERRTTHDMVGFLPIFHGNNKISDFIMPFWGPANLT